MTFFCILVLFALSIHSTFSDGEVITKFSLEESSGSSLQSIPITFGVVFKKGQVSSTSGQLEVVIDSTSLTTQVDVKTTHEADNSVKHAIVSFICPELEASSTLTFELVYVKETKNEDPTGYLTMDDIKSTEIDAKIRLEGMTGSGLAGDIESSFADIINDLTGEESNVVWWLTGPVCTEIIVMEKMNNNLNSKFSVRIYHDAKWTRISASVENVEADYRGNVGYSTEIRIGKNNELMYSKNNYMFNTKSRWRKVFWHQYEEDTTEMNLTPNGVNLRFDGEFYTSSMQIFNYDVKNTEVSDETIDTEYESFKVSSNDIGEGSTLTKYFATTGGRNDIGPFPDWTAKFIVTGGNSKMFEKMITIAELSGSIPIHYRESDSSKSFYGKIISLDDRPTVWLGRETYSYTKDEDKLPEDVGDTSTEWSVDRAHQPSLVYFPYLFTGDYYFLEELLYWAAYDLACSNWDYRESELGLIKDQVRGDAWAIRNVAHAANAAPDEFEEKEYLENKLNNNLEYWATEGNIPGNTNDTEVRFWGCISNVASEGGRPYDAVTDEVGCLSSPWQEDYVLLVLNQIRDMGYSKAEDVIDWFSWYIIDRFSHEDFYWFNGADYRIPVKGVDPESGSGSNGPAFKTWEAVMNGYEKESILDALSTPECGYCYEATAYAALAGIQHIHKPESNEAYEWLKQNTDFLDAFNEAPRFNIIPHPDSAYTDDDEDDDTGNTTLLSLHLFFLLLISLLFF